MPTSQVLSAQQAQVVANLSVITEGSTGEITNFILHPRIGPSQIMTLTLTIDSADIEIEVIYHDQAFEEQDLFGGKKSKGSRQAEPALGV
jgi:hypothetical protein